MTLKQKQALLAYLGYYNGPLDGLWGEKSQRATIVFQRSYMAQEDVDGIFGAATEKRILEVIATGEKPKKSVQIDTAPGWWKDIRYFTRAEFRCPCGKCGGFPVEPEETLVRLADQESAADMQAMAAVFAKLPPGLLKKVLTEDIITILAKYGVVIG